MSIPGQTLSIIDPGLGASPLAIMTPLYFGVCEKGTDNTVYTFSRISDVIATLGQGPLSEAVCLHLGTAGAGGPVIAVKVHASVAGTVGSVTGTGTGTIAISGTPNDAYNVVVIITKAADTVASTPAEFQYSLDGGYTLTESFTVPSSGGFALNAAGANTGLSLTFTGTQAVGDTKRASCIAPFYGPSDLAAGVNAAIAANASFAYMVLTGECDTPVNGYAMANAVASHTGTFFNRFQFVRALMNGGRGTDAASITAYAQYATTRVGVAFGTADTVTKKPFPGWAIPTYPAVYVTAARAGASLISTDLGRVADGSLEGVVAISHDEYVTETLDAKRFITLRTIQGYPGYYITQGRLMSPPGSDYRLWQHGRVIDVACDTAYKSQIVYLNESVRTKADGTIDDRDAVRFEGPVNTALASNLTDPNAANGTPGHVSAVRYEIDRTNNLLSSDTMKASVFVRPRGYIKHIVTELGFTANVGG